MKIYLLRHAIAKERNIQKYPNDDRPLTHAGAKQMHKIARGIARICSKTDVIFCSPMKRTFETAEILKGYVKSKAAIKISRALLPETNITSKIKFLKRLKNKKSIFIVGHEPDLSELLAFQCKGNTKFMEIEKGGLVLTMLGKTGNLQLKEFISPKTLRMLGRKTS